MEKQHELLSAVIIAGVVAIVAISQLAGITGQFAYEKSTDEDVLTESMRLIESAKYRIVNGNPNTAIPVIKSCINLLEAEGYDAQVLELEGAIEMIRSGNQEIALEKLELVENTIQGGGTLPGVDIS